MRDDLVQLLGSHAAAFDLEAWFRALDAEVASAQAVLPPKREIGTWLREQTHAEAERRGLPMIVHGAHLSKSNTKLARALANIRAEGS